VRRRRGEGRLGSRGGGVLEKNLVGRSTKGQSAQGRKRGRRGGSLGGRGSCLGRGRERKRRWPLKQRGMGGREEVA
jgi:hypothetical protein